MVPTPEELIADPWAFGPWVWCVDEVRLFGRLSAPRLRGMPGLFPLPEEVRVLSRRELGVEPIVGLTVLEPFASAIAVALGGLRLGVVLGAVHFSACLPYPGHPDLPPAARGTRTTRSARG